LLGRDHPNAGASKSNLANLLVAKGEYVEAEALLREALRNRRVAFGESHVDYAIAMSNLAQMLESAGRHREALPMLEQALKIATPQLGLDHPRVVPVVIELGRAQIANGQAAAAEAPLRRALAVRERLLQAGDWRIGYVQSLLAAALLEQKKLPEAETLMIAASQSLKPIPGRQGREYEANRARLASLQRGTPRAR
jgi:tetratricopeptide (TPR) repeat protein